MDNIKSWKDVSLIMQESGLPNLAKITGSVPTSLSCSILNEVLSDRGVDHTNPRDVGFTINYYPDIVTRLRRFDRDMDHLRPPQQPRTLTGILFISIFRRLFHV